MSQIPESDQWLLDSECEKCRCQKYCMKLRKVEF